MSNRTWRRTVASMSAALVLVAAGCSGSGGNEPGASKAKVTTTTAATTTTTPARLAAADEKDTWTFFVYMAADNNLEAAAMADLSEMTEASNTRFIVLLDRSPGYSDVEIGSLGNFEGSAMLDIQDGDFTIQELDEVNTGDPDVLSSLIEYGFEQAPDGHHALVVWDHGGSWFGAAWDDSSDSDNLEVAELREGIEDGLEAADQDAFDLIGFDACLMGTYEVATALAPYSAYLLASEEVEPGAGWDWTTTGTPTAGSTTQDLGAKVVDRFVESNDAAGSTDSTLALIDLTALPALDDATAQLAKAMTSDASDRIGRIGSGRLAATGFGRSPVPDQDYWLVDLGDLAHQLSDVKGMEKSAGAMADAIDRIVVHSSSGPAAPKATGLAAYFPSVEAYLDERYEPLELAPSWTSVLTSFYETSSSVEIGDLPTYTVADRYIEEDRVTSDEDGLEVAGDVEEGTGGNITAATLNWGRVHPDDTNLVTWYGERNATVDDDTVSGRYDWTYLVVGSGADEAIGYAEEHYDADGELDLVRVPIRFHRGSSTVSGNLVITVVGRKVYSRFYLRNGDALAEVPAQPGDTFEPLLATQDLTTTEITWEPSIDHAMDAAPTGGVTFTYDHVLPAQPVMVGLSFSDIVGNVDTMYYGASS